MEASKFETEEDFQMAKNKKDAALDVGFKYEYVTSAVSVQKGDGIVVHVVNDSGIAENTHAIIYQNTGAGARIAADSGLVVVTATWNWGLGFTIAESGDTGFEFRVRRSL